MLRLWTSESAPYDGCKYRNHLVTHHLDQYSQSVWHHRHNGAKHHTYSSSWVIHDMFTLLMVSDAVPKDMLLSLVYILEASIHYSYTQL